jgi:hypothetical protein
MYLEKGYTLGINHNFFIIGIFATNFLKMSRIKFSRRGINPAIQAKAFAANVTAANKAARLERNEIREFLPSRDWPHRFFLLSLSASSFKTKDVLLLFALQEAGIKFVWHSWNLVVIPSNSDTTTLAEMYERVSAAFRMQASSGYNFTLSEAQVATVKGGKYVLPYPVIMTDQGKRYNAKPFDKYYNNANRFELGHDVLNALAAAAPLLPVEFNNRLTDRFRLEFFTEDLLTNIQEENENEPVLERKCRKEKATGEGGNGACDADTDGNCHFEPYWTLTQNSPNNMALDAGKVIGRVEYIGVAIVNDMPETYLGF